MNWQLVGCSVSIATNVRWVYEVFCPAQNFQSTDKLYRAKNLRKPICYMSVFIFKILSGGRKKV